jgi:hypothetical protein
MSQRWKFAPAAVLLGAMLGSSSLSLAGDDHAPLPDDRLFRRTVPLLLLSRPDVRADLGMNPTQADEAEKAITDLYVRAYSLKGKTGERAEAGRKAINDAQRAWFEANLTAEQRARLVQIDLQWEGPSCLISRPVVADSVGLSTDQRETLSQAVVRRNKARESRNYSLADEQALAKQALALLTSDQKERFRAMLGRVFVPQFALARTEANPTQ